jgi:hypothetical protein
VTGLPVGKAEPDVQSMLVQTIRDILSNDEQQRLEVRVSCVPSCDGSQTLSALVEFKGGNPKFLSQLDHNPLGDWEVKMGDEDIYWPFAPNLVWDIVFTIVKYTAMEGCLFAQNAKTGLKDMSWGKFAKYIQKHFSLAVLGTRYLDPI